MLLKLPCSVVRVAEAGTTTLLVVALVVTPSAADSALATTVNAVALVLPVSTRWPLPSSLAVTAPLAPRPEMALIWLSIEDSASLAVIATV